MPKIPHLQRKSDRDMEKSDVRRIAINLFDLTDRVPDHVRVSLTGGKIELKPLLVNSDDAKETAVAFSCDLLTAASVCDYLRRLDRKVGDFPTRVYLKKRSAWAKVPGHQALTIVIDGKPALHPVLFNETLPAQPLEAEAI